jgi:eukaryotic-like serine/threonine-protein kinase
MSDAAARLRSALADRYVLLRELGQGGMATVYLAEDVRHQRNVAVKVVHPELAAILGAERFLAEIHVTAALQHPHILPLFDSGQAADQLFYVMPYVEGESLRGRLDREGQLPIEDAVRLTREVASAIDYAHRNGVIHRDIKPENILLHDGRAVVADFGIALAVTNAGGGRLTQTGLSLGTPQYMSPEQATGEREIDARSDIYSLGAVMYEMLTGEPPFTGATAQAVVARIITSQPPLPSAQRKSVPPNVEDAVLKALQKMRADRFATAAEFAAAIGNPDFRAEASRSMPDSPGPRPRWTGLSVGLSAALLLVTTGWAVTAVRAPRTPSEYDVGLADEAPLMFWGRNLTVSPDGEFVIYGVANGSSQDPLWYRSLLSGATRPLEGTEGGLEPRISPDGKLLAFYAYPRLKIVPLAGGTPRTIADVRDPVGLEWTSNSTLFLLDDDGLDIRFLNAQSGETSTTPVAYCIGTQWDAAAEEVLCGGGGRKFAYLVNPVTDSRRVANTSDLDASSLAQVTPGSDFRVVDRDYVVFMSVEGDIVAASYKAGLGHIGAPVRLVQNVRRESYRGTGQFDIAADGTLVYASGPNAEIGSLVIAREGAAPEPLPLPPAAFLRYNVSPDGRRLAAVVQGTKAQELRIYDLRDGRHHLWLAHQNVGEPIWSPGGDRLLTSLSADGGRGQQIAVVIGSPDEAAPPDTVLRSSTSLEPVSWPSDSLILAQDWDRSVVLGLDPRVRPMPIDTLARDASFPSLAPGGRLLSYYAVSTAEVIITPFPARNRRVVATRDGGEAQWLSSGMLNFRAYGGWWRVAVNPLTGEVEGRPERWIQDPRFSDTPGWSQHPTADGALIYVQGPERTQAAYLRVIPDWVRQMKRTVHQSNSRR